MVATWGEEVRPVWQTYEKLPITERYADNIVLRDFDVSRLQPCGNRTPSS